MVVEILIVLAIVIPINLLFLWLSMQRMSEIYQQQFQNLAIIVKEAMAKRDAEVAKYKAIFTRDLIRDANVFDSSMDDLSDFEEKLDEEIDNEREADDSEGTG